MRRRDSSPEASMRSDRPRAKCKAAAVRSVAQIARAKFDIAQTMQGSRAKVKCRQKDVSQSSLETLDEALYETHFRSLRICRNRIVYL
jgi:hypothetical protein